MTGRAKIFLIMTQSFNFILSGKKRATEVALFRSQCHLNLFGDVSDQVQNFVGVTGFVVVPGYQFHEVVVQSDTRFSIEHGSANFAVEIGRYYVIFGVAQNAFHFAFSSSFNGSFDLLVSCSFPDERSGQLRIRSGSERGTPYQSVCHSVLAVLYLQL